jgi:fatty acid desaturase
MENVVTREPPRTAPAGETGPGGETLRQAYALVADLFRPRPAVYYADLAASAAAGWGALVLAAWAWPRPWAAVAFALAVVALYRVGTFIHEITHIRPGTVPGFVFAWNALVGVPLLVPSMMYVGVHGVHHAKAHYGTSRDPEYLVVDGWPAWKIALWVLRAAVLPVALVLRFLVLAPLSLVHPRLRAFVWARVSSLSVNPSWARPPPPPAQRGAFALQEAACFAWALALALLAWRGVVAPRYLVFATAVSGAVGVANQLRTAVAHRFRHRGDEAMTFEEQFLDSVNVPGSPLATELWAPVGLRYHALHHLLPGLPYHNLGVAHRRIVAKLPPSAAYHHATEPTLGSALRALLRG